MGTTQKFFKNFMGCYAIKVLLLAASILISIPSVVAAAEPITIFGVNFDHSPDEAREILEDRFDCKFTAANNSNAYECTKDNYELVKLESRGNHLVNLTFNCAAWDGCVFFGSQKDGDPDKLIYKILVKKYNIPVENQNVEGNKFLGLLGESLRIEYLTISMSRYQFRAAERLNDLQKLMKVFD
jgi:hypothetical protein